MPSGNAYALGTSKFGRLVLTVFAIPFGIFALLAIYRFAERIAVADYHQASLVFLFIVVFGGFAGYFLKIALDGKKYADERDKSQALYPGKPWMWRKDWAMNRCNYAEGRSLATLWMFTVMWNVIAIPIFFIGPEQGNHLGKFGFIFLLIGMGFLWYCIREKLRSQRFGASYFELKTLPGTIGGSLAGSLYLAGVADWPNGLRIKWTSVRRIVTGSGNRSTQESILWQEEATIPELEIKGTGETSIVALKVSIPSNCEQTDDSNLNDQVLWRLTVSADVPGLDFYANFEVPVFRTQDTTSHTESSSILSTESIQEPADKEVQVTVMTTGECEFLFKRARHVVLPIVLTLCSGVWAICIWFLVVRKSPVFFTSTFFICGLAMPLLAWVYWFRQTRVVIDKTAIQVEDSYLLFRLRKNLPVNLLADAYAQISMQNGSSLYYDICLKALDGRTIRAGRMVRNKWEAEWIAAEIKRFAAIT